MSSLGRKHEHREARQPAAPPKHHSGFLAGVVAVLVGAAIGLAVAGAIINISTWIGV